MKAIISVIGVALRFSIDFCVYSGRFDSLELQAIAFKKFESEISNILSCLRKICELFAIKKASHKMRAVLNTKKYF